MYDPSTPQRRPVLEATYGEYPLTTLSLTAAGDSVVVGNTHGQIAVLDLRKGLVRACFKGLAGGVRGLQCHASQPLVASCGLDRFLRIHSLENRRVQHKVYLKSRLNCLLLASRKLEEAECAVGEDGQEVKDEDDDVDEVWDAMEQVDEREQNLKRKTPEEEAENSKRKAQENFKSETSKEGENPEKKTPEEEPPKNKTKKRKKAQA